MEILFSRMPITIRSNRSPNPYTSTALARMQSSRTVMYDFSRIVNSANRAKP